MLGGGAKDRGFLEGRIATARFFAEQMLPQAPACAAAAVAGEELLYAIPAERLVA
jgi:3-(methylthio)propanoyl-CoA dehydrogenase